jgi:hypothetical protein
MNNQWQSIVAYADDCGMEFMYANTPAPHLKLYTKNCNNAILRFLQNSWVLESPLISITSNKPKYLLDLYAKTFLK